MYVGSSNQAILEVKKMLLGETGTYNDIYHRPFKTSLGGSELRNIQEATQNFTNIESETLATCAGNFLHPDANPGSMINVDHGWGEKRWRFMMVVTYEGQLSKTEQVVTGYTDNIDVSYTGELNPATRFFINNVITMRRTEKRTQHGIEPMAVVTDNFQVLRDTTADHSIVTMRPYDVSRTQHASTAMQGLAELGADYDGRDGEIMFKDARMGMGMGEPTRLSRRKNNLNSTYMSSILKSYETARDHNEEYATEDTFFEKSQGQLIEPFSHSNPLLNTLVGNTGFSENSSFTLHELRDLCPYVDQLMVVSRSSGVQALPNMRGQTQGWSGSDNETMIANIIASTVPAIALDHLITKIWFTGTNETITGETVVELEHDNQNPPRSFAEGVDITPKVRSFIQRITHYVMRDITHNNMLGVAVSVRYDALGDTFITVSVNGQEPVPYMVPTSMDSLFSPIVTSSETDLYNMSRDFTTLMDYTSPYGPPQTTAHQAAQWNSTPQLPSPMHNNGGGFQYTPGTLFD